jgi:hypothetical protein
MLEATLKGDIKSRRIRYFLNFFVLYDFLSNLTSNYCEHYITTHWGIRVRARNASIFKILDKLFSIQLINRLEPNGLLHEHQYNFHCNKPTIHNLTHLTNYICSALNNKKVLYWPFLRLRQGF